MPSSLLEYNGADEPPNPNGSYSGRRNNKSTTVSPNLDMMFMTMIKVPSDFDAEL